jgi:hypothetical protein
MKFHRISRGVCVCMTEKGRAAGAAAQKEPHPWLACDTRTTNTWYVMRHTNSLANNRTNIIFCEYTIHLRHI